ncbi:MAG: hypothetical protein KDC43_00455, partial [Saprospiraceae bacterium]|nr:hypothetical protein [Saprospiraceae bacterium]MCB0622411.1 hypothetical protein [Saprospiraceae bacterium]
MDRVNYPFSPLVKKIWPEPAEKTGECRPFGNAENADFQHFFLSFFEKIQKKRIFAWHIYTDTEVV